MQRKISDLNQKAPLQFWMLVGASCVALAVVVLTLSTRTVQANALLSRSAIAAPVASPATSPTPVIAALDAAAKQPTEVFRGVASWYGPIFNGRRTASGERFDMYAMTACHPSLPFGTKVRVVNLTNHRSVVVRITDRSELVEGRIIDLSYGAAKKIAMTKDGLAQVRLEVISLGRSHSGSSE